MLRPRQTATVSDSITPRKMQSLRPGDFPSRPPLHSGDVATPGDVRPGWPGDRTAITGTAAGRSQLAPNIRFCRRRHASRDQAPVSWRMIVLGPGCEPRAAVIPVTTRGCVSYRDRIAPPEPGSAVLRHPSNRSSGPAARSVRHRLPHPSCAAGRHPTHSAQPHGVTPCPHTS